MSNMNSIESRSTTRNFRIPIELDTKVLEIQAELEHTSMTQTWIFLTELGIWCKENLKKLENDPNLLSEIKKEWEQKRKELSSISGAKQVLENMSDDEVYFLKLQFQKEDTKRLLEGEKWKIKKGAEKDKNNPLVRYAQINDPRNTSAIRIVDQD